MPTLTSVSILRARHDVTGEIHLVQLMGSMSLCGQASVEEMTFCDGAEPMDRHCRRCLERLPKHGRAK